MMLDRSTLLSSGAGHTRDNLSGAKGDRMVEVGQTAPDFELPAQNGEPVRLSELRGQTVVVYFYPKADTPGY
jgi:cytochrome oxidase Cu insertion factor (SCO1/SenC/PrrC family)